MLSGIHDTRAGRTDGVALDSGIMDSKRLQMFHASLTEGSFVAAAHLLSVSPSAISHAMKTLEEDLGCALFRRSGPQVKPTGAAVRLLPMVEEILLRMASIRSELAAMGRHAESLVFRVPASLTGIFGQAVLSTFHECFPAADFEIIVGNELNAKPVDFHIDHVQRVPEGMVRRELMVEHFQAYAAPFHELGQKSRLAPTDLKRSLLIFPDHETQEWLMPRLERLAGREMRKWILPDPRAACELACQGQGVVLLPEWAAAEAVAGKTLVCLKLPGDDIRRTCCAWWPPSRPPTWVAEVFLSLLAARIGPDDPL